MNRLRRATTISSAGLAVCPTFLFNLALISAITACGSSAFAADDQSSSLLFTESLSNPISGTGLVLPICYPMPLAEQQSDMLRESSFATLSGGYGDSPVEPIPVPLPPGVATGMIGLCAAAIARYRWKLRRA